MPLAVLNLLKGKDVLVGAIDQIETFKTVAARIREALDHVDADKLYPGTNCGMAPLKREVAVGKLWALSAGAAIVRRELTAG